MKLTLAQFMLEEIKTADQLNLIKAKMVKEILQEEISSYPELKNAIRDIDEYIQKRSN